METKVDRYFMGIDFGLNGRDKCVIATFDATTHEFIGYVVVDPFPSQQLDKID